MSALVDRITEVLKAHFWYFVGNLGVPGMPDQRDPHAHVAERVAEALQLTEETMQGIGCAAPGCEQAGGLCEDIHECGNCYPVPLRRWVSAWTAVEPDVVVVTDERRAGFAKSVIDQARQEA